MSSPHASRRARLLAAALVISAAVVLALGAASVGAATLTVTTAQENEGRSVLDKAVVQMTAGSGEQNVVSLSLVGSVMTLDVQGPVTLGTGCTRPDPANPRHVRCDLTAVTSEGVAASAVRASLGDLNDGVTVNGTGSEVDLGEGDDSFTGGGGSDLIRPGLGNDRLDGGSGRDAFVEGDGPSGSDVFRGGRGRDSVSYLERRRSLAVRLDGRANDGERGERDNVDVEDVFGSAGPNRLVGDASDNELSGSDRGDRISGGRGNDRLRGWAGADRIVGGSGRDLVDGNRGNDRLGTRDGARDRVICGSGRDLLVADRRDIFGRSCERVRRR